MRHRLGNCIRTSGAVAEILAAQDSRQRDGRTPHITVLRGTKSWRINLRTVQFLDRTPAPREVPRQLLRHVLGRFDEFISVWDELYPLNPVQSLERDSDDED